MTSLASTDIPRRAQLARAHLRRSYATAIALAVPLVGTYLIVSPPAGDLAAATYRSDLFARVGFSAWDSGWYAAHGHWLPGYSLLAPALGALLGVRLLLALCALGASALFAPIAERVFEPSAGRAAAVVFALGFCVGMLSGRVPYALGFAIGLGAVLALLCERTGAALGLAVLTSLASPVAGAFLALAMIAYAIACSRRGLTVALAALVPIVALSIAYPEGGYEPFAPSAFWPALGGVTLFALLLPKGPLTPRAWRVLRIGAGLYALALIGAYVLRTPMGGNAARLGALLAAPLVVGVLWGRAPRALAVLAPLLLYWQLATPIRDTVRIADDPSVNASYYAPLRTELSTVTGGRATIVEVPLTRAHWEAAYLPGHDGISLARGWERQLDTRYAALFYHPTLTPSAYRSWLSQNRVAYVALPDVPLDGAGRLERELIARGLPYLRAVWSSAHWRLYRVIG